jgi:folylpolyglutamate synthase/dihydropteroate synthase
LEYKTDAIVKAVEQLKSDTKKLHIMVGNKASDKEITAALSALHDVFHQIVGLCKKENEQH